MACEQIDSLYSEICRYKKIFFLYRQDKLKSIRFLQYLQTINELSGRNVFEWQGGQDPDKFLPITYKNMNVIEINAKENGRFDLSYGVDDGTVKKTIEQHPSEICAMRYEDIECFL